MNLQRIFREFSENKEEGYYVELAKSEVLVVPVLVELLNEGSYSERMRAEALLEKISEKYPKTVYPFFNYIVQALDKSEDLICWSVWKIIVNIIEIDSENLWDVVEDKFVKALSSDKIAEFSIVCDCVLRIINAIPGKKEKITGILKCVKDRQFMVLGEISQSCNAVAVEKVKLLFDELSDEM